METNLGSYTKEGSTLNSQGNLKQRKRLKKQIEVVRRKLHVAFENKRMFSDPDVYRLSLHLDDLIVEYQSRLPVTSQDQINE
jgi:hypothetical protein